MSEEWPIKAAWIIAIASAIVLHILLRQTMFFEDYEGDGSAPRIEDAKFALQRLLPIGSDFERYERFFRSIGGLCAKTIDTSGFPSSILCSYRHGLIVTSEWKYVVDCDRTTGLSQSAHLNFGLTGL